MGGGPQFFGLPFGEGHLFFGPLQGRVTIFWAPGSLKKTFEVYKAVSKKMYAIFFLIFHHLKEGYEQEIGLKMLKMAVLETQTFKIFWGSMPPDPPKKLAPTALAVPSFF